jgi:very-short-patch-repair endonuclease
MDDKDGIPRKLREELIECARAMRKSPTHAELLMWRELRKGQLGGYKFRRQHIIRTFIVDFYCPETKLVIEIDGSVHRNQVEYDQIRENDLSEMGYEVLRFRNEEVVNEISLVLEAVEEKLSQLSEKSM